MARPLAVVRLEIDRLIERSRNNVAETRALQARVVESVARARAECDRAGHLMAGDSRAPRGERFDQ